MEMASPVLLYGVGLPKAEEQSVGKKPADSQRASGSSSGFGSYKYFSRQDDRVAQR